MVKPIKQTGLDQMATMAIIRCNPKRCMIRVEKGNTSDFADGDGPNRAVAVPVARF